MNTELQKELDSFAKLLPGYLPQGPGHPYDLCRWHHVCYLSCALDSPITLSDVVDAIRKHHGEFDENAINVTANSCMKVYEEFKKPLEYLKDHNLLVLPK